MKAELSPQDICIIGAGPAGATTSLFLSKMHIPHTIIDADVFPRDKVCGDGLELKVLRVLNQLDPKIVKDEIFNDPNFVHSRGVRIIMSGNKSAYLNMRTASKNSAYPFFITCKRKYFDHFLVQKINPVYAEFKQGTRVKKLERIDGKWNITALQNGREISFTFRFIIGADGDHSIVLRSLGERKIERKHYAAGLRQYWKGIDGMNEENLLELYLPKFLPFAYLWIFPLPNGEANVGIGSLSQIILKRSMNLKEVFNDIITKDPAMAHRFKNAEALDEISGWGLPFASQKRKASGDGYLLAGDAASLVAPTTGEGVGPAMMSGYIAATFLQRAVAANDFSGNMFKNYDREILRRLQQSISSYAVLRKTSLVLYNHFINVLSRLGISQIYYNRQLKKWLHTAEHEKIKVHF